MSNLINFHPRKSDLFSFYEIVETDGQTRWGGDSPADTLTWLKLAPEGSRVLVSAWDTDDEDAHLVGQPIDITGILKLAMGKGE